jgi:hypothetical protein
MLMRSRVALIAIIALLVAATSMTVAPQKAASDTPILECGSNVKPEEAAAFRARWAVSPPVLSAPSVGSYCVPIAAHIVRRTDGTGGLPMSQLDQAMVDANNYYINTGISYYLLSIDYIDSDHYYFDIDTYAEIDALKGENVVADAINIYFTPNLSSEDGGLCGLSSFTTSAVQGIAMANDCVGVATNPSSYPHEIGHYFDLFHTHETAFGAELVDGSNCATAGDLLCDTPADPGLITSGPSQNIDANCNYYGTETDANGDSYSPDTHQLMSYAPKLCRTTISPLGEARAVMTLLTYRSNLLNRGCPPDADAGPDITAECSSPTTTAVMLDGTGSSDPDGDMLSYSWVATGVTFDDATLAQPTGQFPYGTTEVVLTVSDGMLSDQDTMYVTIEDTTPPDITCPAAVTVECVEYCGVPKGDAQLTAFFAGVSANDDCCGSTVTITNKAPDCFPLGDTSVWFTAEDCHGNSDSCVVVVTVEDTTPPEIDVVLNRDVLWPPNHKMADITANVTVSDICCATPTFVLTSVTSNEPDNGKGDGNTVNDIQGVQTETPDLAFQLRSERSGGGDGRIYTITYTATDCSGNTADDVVYVRVPHDHSGWAFASMGFESGGLSFDPALDRFVLIIPSKAAEYTVGVNGEQILVSEAFDATALDVTRAYVGNVKDVTLPNERLVIDNNADGLMDVALYYSAKAVNGIIQECTKTDGDKVGLDASWGAIGLHYVSASGVDYLVPNIFGLGEPVPLVPPIEIGRSSDMGGNPEPSGHDGDTPVVTMLGEMYPNPFNPSTTIPFNLVSQERVLLRIYDASGKLVRTLVNEVKPAGTHQAVWDGRDSVGSQVATGVYFVRFIAGNAQMTKKVVMIK